MIDEVAERDKLHPRARLGDEQPGPEQAEVSTAERRKGAERPARDGCIACDDGVGAVIGQRP